MKRSFVLTFISTVALFASKIAAQEDGKKKIEQEMQQFNQQYNADFEDFKRRREQEIRKLQQEYQDYYNNMLGLKRYYEEKKDTAAAKTVSGIIDYEQKVSAASGKILQETEKVNVTPQTLQTKYGKSADSPTEYKVKTQEKNVDVPTPSTPEKPAISENTTPATTAETTLKPLSNEIYLVPSQTPLPKEQAKITSPFGYRLHPILKIPKMHTGIDFGSSLNTPVYAAANGKVILVDQNSTYGNYLVLEHSNGYTSVYAHLAKILVTKGDIITFGSLIGYSGNTGRSTAPHLHYEVRLNGTPVDPKGYLNHYR